MFKRCPPYCIFKINFIFVEHTNHQVQKLKVTQAVNPPVPQLNLLPALPDLQPAAQRL